MGLIIVNLVTLSDVIKVAPFWSLIEPLIISRNWRTWQIISRFLLQNLLLVFHFEDDVLVFWFDASFSAFSVDRPLHAHASPRLHRHLFKPAVDEDRRLLDEHGVIGVLDVVAVVVDVLNSDCLSLRLGVWLNIVRSKTHRHACRGWFLPWIRRWKGCLIMQLLSNGSSGSLSESLFATNGPWFDYWIADFTFQIYSLFIGLLSFNGIFNHAGSFHFFLNSSQN